jgi:hypothetical protein
MNGAFSMTRLALALSLVLAAPAALAQDALSVTLQIEPETAGYLAAVGEQVVVRAAYFGEPVAADAAVDDTGRVALGDEAKIVPAEDQVVALGSALGQLPLDSVKVPMVSFTVSTAALAFPDNMLDCTPMELPIAEASAAENVVTCKLLGM